VNQRGLSVQQLHARREELSQALRFYELPRPLAVCGPNGGFAYTC
jgi:hypothetical protein